jgi:hypothetical protein
MLIETRRRVRPGEREIVLLTGTGTVKVVGWIERVEITRLVPMMSYRTALRFASPVMLSTLRCQSELDRVRSTERPRSGSDLETAVSSVVDNTLESWIRRISGVEAVGLSASVMRMPGTEPIHFAVPASSFGESRKLQVFFTSGAVPTAEEFAQLRHLAEVASTMPDLRIAASS